MSVKQIILIPDLTSSNAVSFCGNDYDFSEYTDVLFDFKYTRIYEPFAMLVIGSKIRQLISEYEHISFFISNYSMSYPNTMGFFKSIGFNSGKNPGESKGSETYLPITELLIKDLKNEAYEEEQGIVQEVIEKKSIDLAQILLPQGGRSTNLLAYSIREIIRNSVEHSETKKVWIAAQKWPTKDKVEIAILDEGVGIKQALSFNPNINSKSDREAILLSLEPGISGKAFKHNGRTRKQNLDRWNNSGYGLFATNELCRKYGSFLVCSNSTALEIKKDHFEEYDINLNGTAILISLNISEINKIDGDVISDIISSGEKIAKQNSSIPSIISASKVSRLWDENVRYYEHS